MTARSFCRTVFACGLLISVSPALAKADPPEGVIRTFAVSVNSLEQAPDFLSDLSRGLVVAPPDTDTTPDFLQFAASNCDPRFNSTVWVHQQALHLTTDGAETIGSVFWLLDPEVTPEPPPMGAITFTGPDSLLIRNQEPVYYETFSTGYRTNCSSGGAGVLWVVTAVFSR